MQRVEWIDSAKGFALLLVLIGHTWDGLGNRDLIDQSLYQSVYEHIYVFHMPFFFMLSGFFVSVSFFKIQPFPFARIQFWQMIYPMVLWYYIFLTAKIIMGGYANEVGDTSMLLNSPIPGHWHYWFLWALMLMRVLIYLMRPVLINSRYFTPVLLVLLVTFIIVDRLPQSEWVVKWLAPAISFSPFFIIGILIGRHNARIRPSNLNACLAGIGFVAMALLFSYLSEIGIDKLPISILMSLCSIYIFKWLGLQTSSQSNLQSKIQYPRIKKMMKWLAVIGVLSMPIYLAHPIFSSFVREALLLGGVTDVSLHMIIGTIVAVLGSLLMYHFSVRLKLNVVLGFNIPKAK